MSRKRTHREKESLALLDAVDRTIDYARENGIGSIIIAGSSAAYVRDLFKERWKKRFGKYPETKFYSLGKTVNNIFCRGESMTTLPKQKITKEQMGLFAGALWKKFGANLNKALANEKALLLDDSGNGKSLLAIKKIIQKAMNTKDLRTGILITRDNSTAKEIDFTGRRMEFRFLGRRNYLTQAKKKNTHWNRKRIESGMREHREISREFNTLAKTGLRRKMLWLKKK